MKIMHLIDSLDYGGSARQVRLLGPALLQENMDVEVCCLGPAHRWADDLRQAGVSVRALNWTRWFDPSVWWNLRQTVQQSAPDLLHVWRMPALRVLAAVCWDRLSSVVMSAPWPPKGSLPWWDRWLLRRVRCLTVGGVSDQQRCVQHGLVTRSLTIVPPAVTEATRPDRETPDRKESPRLNPRSILAIGKLERDEGFHQAIWAFDIVRQIYDRSELLLVGTGSQHADLCAMAQGLQSSHLVRFLGESRVDVSALLSAAEVVWVPSAANCGRQVALEAMAQGRVVIASDVPCLRDVIIEGETGYLVSVGDVVQFARRTHVVFQDERLREQLGQAAQRYVTQRFSVKDATARWRELYHQSI
jgi:glycosyltransferase involved in cell wall biosynthesis